MSECNSKEGNDLSERTCTAHAKAAAVNRTDSFKETYTKIMLKRQRRENCKAC